MSSYSPSLTHFVPDLLLEHQGNRLISEIAVFHRAEREKLRILRRLNLPALEICLTPEDNQLDRTALTRKLLETTEGKIWLFHPRQRVAETEWFSALRQAVNDSRQAAAAERARAAESEAALAGHSATKAKSAPSLPSAGSREWPKENVWADQFNRRYGRYPSIAEALAHKTPR